MKKNSKLNTWLWKWHFIGGLVSLPFILILSITGVIYLFKADYDAPRQKHIKEVTVTGVPVTFENQWKLAKEEMHKTPSSMVIPKSENQATEFVSGRFSHKTSLFINPYTSQATGKITGKEGLMYKVRKLHGELLLGKFGTKIVELIASWMVVLIITGLYVWWPARGWKLKGFFVPRTKEGKRTLFRDLHSISGFWMSILLLMVLAGGFPWTDVVGENFKWVQKVTNTGFPATWQGRGVESIQEGYRVSLDDMVAIAKEENLPGEVSIAFPKGAKGVYSISNVFPENLEQQQMIHYDQYSGQKLLGMEWQEVGSLMRGRMWFMAFHQGQFGKWNWMLMIFVGAVLALMSLSALFSYVLRKRKGSWGVPKVPIGFKVGYIVIGMLALLAIVFPLFGASLLLILGVEFLRKKRRLS